jgi:uncharacterized membrane protein YfcA
MMAVVAILIGLTTGVVSGLIGLGGGVFIVPALVYVFKMSGGRWPQAISDLILRRVFAVTLVVVATRMWFER